MAEAEHGPSLATFVKVFVALMILLAMTVGFAFIDFDRILPGLSTTVALLIAAAKAVLIIFVFMEVKYHPRLTWAFAGAGFLWLAIMVSLTLLDYYNRHDPLGVNDRGEPRYLDQAHK